MAIPLEIETVMQDLRSGRISAEDTRRRLKDAICENDTLSIGRLMLLIQLFDAIFATHEQTKQSNAILAVALTQRMEDATANLAGPVHPSQVIAFPDLRVARERRVI